MANTPPVATINNQTVIAGRWAQASLWLSYSDANNDPPVLFQFQDNNAAAGSAYFWTPDVGQQPANIAIAVNASDVVNVWIKGATAATTDAMQVRAFDGKDWSAWDPFTITTIANSPPSIIAPAATVIQGRWIRASSLFQASDTNNDPILQYRFVDEGVAPDSAYFWTPGNSHVPANVQFTVDSSDLDNVWIRGGNVAGQETMAVAAYDGWDWSNFANIALTTQLDHAPVVAPAGHSLAVNHWAQVAGWLNYSDDDGDAPVQYLFSDSGTGADSAYFWTPDNSHHAANSDFVVNASDINNVWVKGGAVTGADPLWVRAFDGTDWSNWQTFALTTVANTPPVVTATAPTIAYNQWVQASTLLGYSDADNDPAVQYQFLDHGSGDTTAYLWTPDDPRVPENTAITVNASDLGSVWIRGGLKNGGETMVVRAFDGADWSGETQFIVSTVGNAAPVATINDHSLARDQWAQVSNWISYSDADGNLATQYQFSDGGTGANSAYFWTPDNTHHAANADFTVNAADLSTVWVRGGAATGTDSMWVRAFDGIVWGAWDQFTLTTT